MFGDMVLYVKLKWRQFWCIHNYKYDPIGSDVCRTILRECTKCERIR